MFINNIDKTNWPFKKAATIILNESRACKKQILREKELSEECGIVYLIVVDDEIYKVGGSSKDINKLMSQYQFNIEKPAKAQITRLINSLLQYKEILLGKKVEFWYNVVKPYYIERVSLLNSEVEMEEVNDFHALESSYIHECKRIDGEYPVWNIEENSETSWEDSFPIENKIIKDTMAAANNDERIGIYDRYKKLILT